MCDDLTFHLCWKQRGWVNALRVLTILNECNRQFLFDRILSQERKRGNMCILADQQKIPDYGTQNPAMPHRPQDIKCSTFLLLYQPGCSAPTHMHQQGAKPTPTLHGMHKERTAQ